MMLRNIVFLQLASNLLYKADILWNRLVPSLENTETCEIRPPLPQNTAEPIVETSRGQIKGIRKVDDATGELNLKKEIRFGKKLFLV